MAIGSVLIDANPVLAWESFVLSLDRKYIVNPRTEYRDIGGPWKFTFNIHPDRVTRAMASDFLENGAMRQIRQYNDKGELEWGGFIAKVVESTGTTRSELNLMNVFNRQWCRYNTGSGIARSTKFNDANSQAIVGIIERVIIAGEVSLTIADQHIEQLMDWTSYPSPGVRQIDFGGKVTREPSLEITALGWSHTLNFRTYNQTGSSGDADASTIVSAIVTDAGQFIDSTYIETNVSQLEQEFDTDRKADEILNSIAQVGDSGFNKWIWGVDAEREFYYKQAAKPVR